MCTFTNEQQPTATLTIIKDAVPDDPQDFTFFSSAVGPDDFILDDDGVAGSATPNQMVFVLSGDQLGPENVGERVTPGWGSRSDVCVGDDDATTFSLGWLLDIEAGEDIVCTFTNYKDATLTIVKDALPDHPQDFLFNGTGTGVTNFTLDDDGPAGSATPNSQTFTFGGFNGGEKVIQEAATDGWSTTVECTGDTEAVVVGKTATVDVDPGEEIICTFTNVKTTATIIVEKQTEPDGAFTSFAFTSTIPGKAAFNLTDGQTNSTEVDPGVYTATEAAVRRVGR